MGLGFLCLAALVFGSNEPRFRDVMIGSGILGLIILGITVRVAGAVKTKYSALISTSSGEIKAYTSDDEVFMKNIVESINQAMAQNR